MLYGFDEKVRLEQELWKLPAIAATPLLASPQPHVLQFFLRPLTPQVCRLASQLDTEG
jgi:hypothetical protein